MGHSLPTLRKLLIDDDFEALLSPRLESKRPLVDLRNEDDCEGEDEGGFPPPMPVLLSLLLANEFK